MRDSAPAKGSHDSNRLELGILAGLSHPEEEAQLLGLNTDDDVLPGFRTRGHVNEHWSLLRGPDPPRFSTIQPIYPALQKAPIKWIGARRTDSKILLTAALFFWLLIFTLTLRSQLPTRADDGQHVINLDCTDTFWKRKNECGLDGIDCRPFQERSFAFKCPASCLSVKVLNPRAVGPIEVNYRPLVIGSSPYRGDSFICGAAIHAGIISDARGGCGRVNLLGKRDQFMSTKQNGIESIAFDSYFPLSFSVQADGKIPCTSDPRSFLLLVSLIITATLSVFSTSPSIFFPIFVLIFAHVSFVSDPPQASFYNITVLPDHISMFAKRLLPALFVAFIMYSTTIRRTLAGITAQYEKAVLWLGGFWIGALSNYTFDWIPISRLTAHDLKQQPGAKLALAIIIIVLIVIIFGQAYHFWLEGRLPRYLGLYGLFILGILLCLAIPGVNLRIHHYILALLLLPGTSLQTRPSLLYQGILLGLFVNGVARWDFDSVLQTSDALRNDATFDSIIPKIMEPNWAIENGVLTASFSWPEQEGMDGFSMLVNDVERAREFYDDSRKSAKDYLRWAMPTGMDIAEYVRFAYVRGGRTLDYSNAGVLKNGTWTMTRESGSKTV